MRSRRNWSDHVLPLLLVCLLMGAGLSLLPSAVLGEGDRAPAYITVDTSTEYQTITAWEATAWMGQDTSTNLANYSNEVMALAVDELGLNRLRLEVRAGVENPEDYWTQWQEGVINYTFWREHRYTTVNDDADPDHINWSSFHFSELDHTVETVVLPFMTRVRANGGTPLINLNYVAFTSQNGAGTSYIHDDPDEYAEFMLAVFTHLDTEYGLTPDYLEVLLEPDNVAQWNGFTIGNAIVATSAKLASAGYEPMFIAPSNTNMGGAVSYFDQMATVEGAVEALTELSYHRYGGVSDANLRSIDQRRAASGLDTAMLEHIGSGHEDLVSDLTLANCSSWQQFTLAGFGPTDNGGAYLLIDETNPSDPLVTMGWRTKLLRQYFAYVRPGAVRVGAATSDPAYQPVAFVNADGGHVVVIKADAVGTFTISGLPAGTYGLTYTTTSVYDVSLPNATVDVGGSLTASIPAAGALTITELFKAPAIDVTPSSPDVQTHEGMTVDFTVTPRNANPSSLIFEWTLDGIVVADDVTSWTYEPGLDSDGNHVLIVRVWDPRAPALVTSFAWYITVLNVNRAPVILSSSPESFWMVNETADGEVVFTVEATDLDGDTLVYNWYADSRWVSGSTDTYSFPYDYSSAGDHDIYVSVSDGIDNTEVYWTLRVLNVNRAPVMLSREPGEEVSVNETEYGYLYLTVDVWDADGDSLTYEWTLDGTRLYSERYSTYTFRFDHDSAGDYVVNVAVTDGQDTVRAGWLVTVIDVNVPPRISSTYPSWYPRYYEAENASLQFSVSAYDPEGAEMTYMWFTNGTQVPGANEPTYLHRYGYGSAGEHVIQVVVSDGMDEVNYTWYMTVYDTNRAPVVEGCLPDYNVTTNDRKSKVLEVLAYDPDDDNLTYQWYLNGSWIPEANLSVFTFEPERNVTGNFTMTVVIYDGRGGYATHVFNLSVVKYIPPEEWHMKVPWWAWVLVILGAVTGVMWLLYWGLEQRHRKGPAYPGYPPR